MSPKVYAKAIVGAAVAGIAYAAPVVDDGLIPSEVLGILLAALTAFAGVFFTPNGETEVSDAGESVRS